jgi:hypothetical protein
LSVYDEIVHTQLRNTLIVASLVALALCASALPQTEIRLGWRVTSASPHAPTPPAPTLGWSTNPPLPKGAAEDLNDIKNAFDLLAISRKAVVVSDNGSYLLVEKAGPTLQALNSVTGHVVSSRPGGLGPSMNDASPAGRDACVGYQPAAGECVFQVSLAGELTVTQWPYQLNGESTVCVSPNRKLAITQKQTPVGFVPRYCRRTPNALPSDTPREWPVLPLGTQMQDIGWLAWQP